MRLFNIKLIQSVISFLGILTISIMIPGNINSKILTNVQSDISGEAIRAVVVEDFEKGQVGKEGWDITSTPKKFTSDKSSKKLKMKDPVPTIEIKIISGKPNDMIPEEWSLTGLGKVKEKLLGIHFRFQYPGENSVSIVPPKEVRWHDRKPVFTYNPNTGKQEQERGIQLPGKAKAISLWVHGRGHPYNLELWLKDYRGSTHILKFGSVNFVGWRPLKVYVPANVPQEFQSYPQTRTSKITKFVLRAEKSAHHEELTADVFFFFDQLKVIQNP